MVVDLGSGGGFDCFIAARQVGSEGRVIGVDMTPEMVSLARLNKKKALQQDLLIVDLRDARKYELSHIKGAVSHTFDDFLKSILVEGEYSGYKQKEVVLICDTGHLSRVAAGILSEEGFVRAVSLNRGMRRWNRWQNLLRIQGVFNYMRLHCCV